MSLFYLSEIGSFDFRRYIYNRYFNYEASYENVESLTFLSLRMIRMWFLSS